MWRIFKMMLLCWFTASYWVSKARINWQNVTFMRSRSAKVCSDDGDKKSYRCLLWNSTDRMPPPWQPKLRKFKGTKRLPACFTDPTNRQPRSFGHLSGWSTAWAGAVEFVLGAGISEISLEYFLGLFGGWHPWWSAPCSASVFPGCDFDSSWLTSRQLLRDIQAWDSFLMDWSLWGLPGLAGKWCNHYSCPACTGTGDGIRQALVSDTCSCRWLRYRFQGLALNVRVWIYANKL